ncbi:MAG: hypothetical protein QUV02_02995 [Maricaulis sp.]|uniref:hypothetical protein n=1 Tax=Maricaulis sp. TaxID=1486257 RepID=UPI001B1589A8|nr:hypothetical protein [Maricaulis sp.]MBO6730590.1 hypothetical protein [Maricaulis sp.]MBO6848543.1 hypothetical protein [Maricaulis sp.]MBO6878448.1 hypothetical protein [Maricaulis sp.]MDM7983388.1 hypothetical protein [Maricaulis sp.]
MIRSIRMLPLALIAAALGNGLAELVGVGGMWAPVIGAIAGGWTLGVLCRSPQASN